MNTWLFYDATGKVLQQSISDAPPLFCAPVVGVAACTKGNGGGFYYVDVETKKALLAPNRPCEFHVFDYVQKCWIADTEAKWHGVKRERYYLLSGSDWVVVKSQESLVPVPSEWVAYRQALRDITDQPDPFNIVWPIAPQ